MKKKELIYYIIMSNLMWTMCLGMALLQKFVFHIAYLPILTILGALLFVLLFGLSIVQSAQAIKKNKKRIIYSLQ